MFKWQVKFGLLVYAVALISCHSSAPKAAVQSVQKKDTVKAVVQKADKKEAPHFLITIDTIVNKDTLKVVWCENGLIKCSLNQLLDSIINPNVSWDIRDAISQLDGGLDRILVPYNRKPRKFILNDEVVLISLVDWKGRANLFILNRTKTSLKFAKEDDCNPICKESTYIYVDLKHNIIINHGGQDKYEHGKYSDAGNDASSNSPYWIYRYQITNRHFVQTKLDTLFFKEFLKIDVNDCNGAQIFYNIIAHRESRELDKYMSHD
jgi:hypothetical protein